MSESKAARRTVGFIRRQTPDTACWLRQSSSPARDSCPTVSGASG